ncbi:MAG: cytochrome c3 family protein [Thermoanaerobaculales bacterium]|nr:cytochrome c3 family protein [Thermoanaerobaculales bacterium]
MKRVLIITAVIIAATGMATAQSVVGTPHDLSSGGPGATGDTGRVCAFCHTPHQPTGQATDPLWNHTLAGANAYGVYDSDTMDAVDIVDINGLATVSNLCMSCHDGSVAVNSLYNVPNDTADGGTSVVLTDGGLVSGGVLTGTALLGLDLTNDHPINFTYDGALVTADGGLNDPTASPVLDLLFGGTVQCASCHDPHDNSNTSFLVMDNVGSALCITCHQK